MGRRWPLCPLRSAGARRACAATLRCLSCTCTPCSARPCRYPGMAGATSTLSSPRPRTLTRWTTLPLQQRLVAAAMQVKQVMHATHATQGEKSLRATRTNPVVALDRHALNRHARRCQGSCPRVRHQVRMAPSTMRMRRHLARHPIRYASRPSRFLPPRMALHCQRHAGVCLLRSAPPSPCRSLVHLPTHARRPGACCPGYLARRYKASAAVSPVDHGADRIPRHDEARLVRSY